MGYRIAIAGATGNVGREILNILSERGFPATEVFGLASRRSQGKEISFCDQTLKASAMENFDWSKADIYWSFAKRFFGQRHSVLGECRQSSCGVCC